MSWADPILRQLMNNQAAILRAGNRLVTESDYDDDSVIRIEPIPADTEIRLGDVVVAMVRGHSYLQPVTETNPGSTLYRVGEPGTPCDAWVGVHAIYGRVTSVKEPESASTGAEAPDASVGTERRTVTS